ncbi:MAG: response regulator [Nitrospirales bacterium]|nr:response regulator [Nitrospira sp.]MDR4459261.1 response regulator [Nitrospirales bacterium]MDR4483217.1 response regulator [Nitrospirales bacterium]
MNLPIHTILLVDDNPDDCEIVKEAWDEIPVGQELRCVNDGTELLDYLYRRGLFSKRECAPRPSVILLDLNMPHMTGGEVLTEIKKDSSLACIPIVVLTTSKASRDICHTAGIGVNGYIQKPNSYAGYLQMFTNLRKHWTEILTQPLAGNGGDCSTNVAWC